MVTLQFDSHDFISKLTASGMPGKQAEALLQELQDINLNHVATKEDIQSLQHELKEVISSIKIDILKWLFPMMLGQTGLTIGIIIGIIKLL